MEESVFFNRGNALAADVDLQSLYVAAQLEKDRSGLHEPLVIVRGGESDQYLLFKEKSFLELTSTQKKSGYQIIDTIR